MKRDMKRFVEEIQSWIGQDSVDVEKLREHIHLILGEKYEIGDAGLIINKMLAAHLLSIYGNKIICNVE